MMAILAELKSLGIRPLPCERTIERVLERILAQHIAQFRQLIAEARAPGTVV